MHPTLIFFRLPQIDGAAVLLKGDRTDGAECSVAAPAPFKFRCVCPGKLFDFGLLLNGQRFALTLSMRTEENKQIGVLAQVRPQNGYCLPQGLKLKVTLNHNTDNAESESAIARECDQIIQLAFSEAVGRQFKVEAIYQDAVVMEEFVL